MASPQVEALAHVLVGDEDEARRIVALLGRSSRSSLRMGLLRLLALLNEEETEEAEQMVDKERRDWRTRQCSVTGCTRRAVHQMASGVAPHRSLFYLCAEHYAAGTVTVIRGTEGPDDG